MRKLIPKTVPAAIVLATLMYLPAVSLRSLLTALSGIGDTSAGLARFAGYAALALIAITAMAFDANDGGWSRFGFAAPRSGWLPCAAGAAAVGIASSFALKLADGGGLDAAMGGIAPTALVAMVIVATLVEELFVRGWMFGFLEPIRSAAVRLDKRTISVRVLVCAVFFGAMHLTLAKTSIDVLTLVVILAFTILLGICCGIAREKSGSLLAAIATHFAGNVGGVVGGVAYLLLTGGPHAGA